jgi:hypothetical protein
MLPAEPDLPHWNISMIDETGWRVGQKTLSRHDARPDEAT